MNWRCAEVLADIATYPDFEFHTVFCDPPYQLGTEWRINPENGAYEVKGKASDFMNKWPGLDHTFLRTYFAELFRVLKYGGYALHYCVGRQRAPMEYYAKLAGFETEVQGLSWYFISNFPKAADAGKAIDKRSRRDYVEAAIKFGVEIPGRSLTDWTKEEHAPGNKWWTIFKESIPNEMWRRIEREVIGKGSSGKTAIWNEEGTESGHNLTAPATPLAQTFDGYKYGRACLKSCLETILVFRKPTKGSSVLDDLMNCMEDPEISPAVINVDGGRVPTEETVLNGKGQLGKKGIYGQMERKGEYVEASGRHPSDLFLSPETAAMLDEQSGEQVSKSGARGGTSPAPMSWGESRKDGNKVAGHDDSGGCSRINHIVDFEKGEHELLIYCPKVSSAEREAGMGGFEYRNVAESEGRNQSLNSRYRIENGQITGTKADSSKAKNFHPTLKPIALNTKIAALFMLPPECGQKWYVPFSGAGSEVIGIYRAGGRDITAVELDPDNVEIARARFEHWKDKSPDYSPTQTKDPGDVEGQQSLF